MLGGKGHIILLRILESDDKIFKPREKLFEFAEKDFHFRNKKKKVWGKMMHRIIRSQKLISPLSLPRKKAESELL